MRNSHKPSITAAFLLVLPLAIFIFLSYNFSPPQQSTDKCPIKPEKLIPKNHPQLSQLHEKFHTDPIYRRRITHLLSSAIQIPTVSIDVMEGGERVGYATVEYRFWKLPKIFHIKRLLFTLNLLVFETFLFLFYTLANLMLFKGGFAENKFQR